MQKANNYSRKIYFKMKEFPFRALYKLTNKLNKENERARMLHPHKLFVTEANRKDKM